MFAPTGTPILLPPCIIVIQIVYLYNYINSLIFMQLLLKLCGRISIIFFTGMYFFMGLWVDIEYSFSLNPLMISIKQILQKKNASVT